MQEDAKAKRGLLSRSGGPKAEWKEGQVLVASRLHLGLWGHGHNGCHGHILVIDRFGRLGADGLGAGVLARSMHTSGSKRAASQKRLRWPHAHMFLGLEWPEGH